MKINTNNIFKNKNKSIDIIQQILAFVKAKFLGKKVISIIKNFIIIFERKNLWYNEKKITSKDKCFNYHKLDIMIKIISFLM